MLNSDSHSVSLAHRLWAQTQRSLGIRFALSFGTILAMLISVTVISLALMAGMSDRMRSIVEVSNRHVAHANTMISQATELGSQVRTLALLTDVKALDAQYAAFKSSMLVYQQTEKELSELLVANGANAAEIELMQKVQATSAQAMAVMAETAKLGVDGNSMDATSMMTDKVLPSETSWRERVMQLIALEKEINLTAYTEARRTESTARISLVVGSCLAIAISGFLAWAMTRSVTGPITSMQTTMTDIASSQDFSRRVPVGRMDEIGLSIVAFNAMIGKIQESSTQLRQKTADIQAMMQYIPQGILTVQDGNKVHPEFSAYLQTILETPDIAGLDVMALIFANSQCNAEIQSQVEATIAASIGEDAMNFEFNEHLLVREVHKTMPDGRVKILDLSWSPITDDQTVVRIMLCVRDVTEVKKLAEQAGAQKRELEIIGQILAINQEKFHEFVDSSAKFLSENKQLIDEVGEAAGSVVDPDVITQLFRNMHTVKGNARTYGLLHLTNLVHEAEQAYDTLRKDPEATWDHEKLQDQLASAFAAIEEYAHINEVKLGRRGPGRRGGVDKFLMVQIDQIQQAIGILDCVDWTNIGEVRDAVACVQNYLVVLGAGPIESILAGVSDSLPSLAKELGKEVPRSTILDHGILIKNQVADLVRNVFMHLYRNSMDHGIESAAQRLASGKAPAGHIQLELALSDSQLQFTLRDDGRGLAIDLIRARAIERGLITPDQALPPEDVAQLIFQPGFSTAAQVTEVSGRGVGMDAVKGFLKREGGSIELCFLGPDTTGSGYRPFETVITLPAKLAVRVGPAMKEVQVVLGGQHDRQQQHAGDLLEAD